MIAAAERMPCRRRAVALDIGCGIGRHALALAAIGYRVTGIDGSDSGIAYAARDAERHGLDIDFRERIDAVTADGRTRPATTCWPGT